MASVMGEPRIFFIDGFNIAHPFRDLPLTTNDRFHYIVRSATGSEYPLELIASVTNGEIPALKKAEKSPEAKIAFRLQKDEYGEFFSLELDTCRPDSSYRLKFFAQSYGPSAVRNGRRSHLTGLQTLQHNDIIYIEDLGSFKVDLSNIHSANTLENSVVIPSSEGERNDTNGAVQTQQFFTPCVDSCAASTRIEETPLTTSKTSLKTSTSEQAHSNGDAGDYATDDETSNRNTTTSKKISTKIVDDSDTENVSFIEIGTRKRRSVAEMESPMVKRLKAEGSPTPIKKPRGRPRKTPLALKEPKPEEELRRVKSKLMESVVIGDSSSQRNEQHSPEMSETSPSKKLIKKPKVVTASSLDQGQANKKFLERFIILSDKLDETTDILCILNGELKSTIKIFKALALGIPIVSDRWFSDSIAARRLLPFEDFLARDVKNEKYWGVSPDWASGHGGKRNALFDKHTIIITEELKQTYGASFRQLRELCQLMGATDLSSAKDINSSKNKTTKKDNSIWLAKDVNDKLVNKLKDKGIEIFSKDFLTASIFRGKVDIKSKQFKL